MLCSVALWIKSSLASESWPNEPSLASYPDQTDLDLKLELPECIAQAQKLFKRRHARPTNPESYLELQGMDMFQSSSIGRWEVAVPKISMVMTLCQRLCCAALRCAVPHCDVPGDAPRDAPEDAPRDMPGGRAAERPKGRASGRAKGRTAGLARGTRHGTCQ